MHVYILVYVTDVHKVTLSSRVGERQAGIRADASPAGVLKIVILPLVPHASERRVSRKVCVSSQACLYSLHLQHVQWLTPWLETCMQDPIGRSAMEHAIHCCYGSSARIQQMYKCPLPGLMWDSIPKLEDV